MNISMNEKRPILKNRFYLYLTEFFSGMSVMAVELGASRLMAPYFSSSQIVWTIIIGTIMIAMALGNIYGGRSADKNPNPDKLYGRIIIAAIWIALIPVLGKYVILGISALLIFTVNSNFLIIAGFAAYQYSSSRNLHHVSHFCRNPAAAGYPVFCQWEKESEENPKASHQHRHLPALCFSWA